MVETQHIFRTEYGDLTIVPGPLPGLVILAHGGYGISFQVRRGDDLHPIHPDDERSLIGVLRAIFDAYDDIVGHPRATYLPPIDQDTNARQGGTIPTVVVNGITYHHPQACASKDAAINNLQLAIQEYREALDDRDRQLREMGELREAYSRELHRRDTTP